VSANRSWRERAFEAAQHGFYSRHEFARAERLGNVIVGAEFESQDAVGFAAFCGEKNDWDHGQRLHLSDLAAELQPVFPRDHDVKNEEGGALALGVCEDAVSRGIHADGESGTL